MITTLKEVLKVALAWAVVVFVYLIFFRWVANSG